MDSTPTAVSRMAAACRALVAAPWFNVASFAVIVLNALTLGLETYRSVVATAGPAFHVVEYAFLACFSVELLIRLAAHLPRPGGFFRDGWNLFDLAIILAPLVPGVRENVTVLRLLRLARIVRAFRLFPSLRVILVGIRRSLPGLGSFLLITVLVLYGYAMLGWMVFGKAYPEEYGTIGQAMLTLFLLLSLDGITDTLQAGREVTEWGIVYYLSYMIAASYLLTNLLVGIVLNALQEAHQVEKEPAPAPDAGMEQRLAVLRTALEELEREYARSRSSGHAALPRPPLPVEAGAPR
ncbi:ion transporter [Dactylosporangium sp. NPDC048998]|uniref:ion transporter n=1 Tax=Dactylosporangium sp. NPDC048998 TaxID=3363976 RepID=UPI00371AD286